MKVIIITKAIGTDGPSRGAICIANAISDNCNVTFISLSNKISCAKELNSNINILICNKFTKILRLFYDLNLGKLSIKKYNTVISMTFFADLFSILLIKSKNKLISIRGDLFNNYKDTYGVMGKYLAWLHYFLAYKANKIICLSDTMEKQIKKSSLSTRVEIIENFIDENKYNSKIETKCKNKKISRFIFIGSLTNRKNIFELIQTFKKLIFDGEKIFLDVVGDGSIKIKIENYIKMHNLKKNIRLVGQVKDPENYLLKADVFILPSSSEGISRAILESLYFRVPVIAKNIPQNKEVILNGKNGWLFNDYNDLYFIIKKVVSISKKNFIFNSPISLIPSKFQYSKVKIKWLKLLEVKK